MAWLAVRRPIMLNGRLYDFSSLLSHALGAGESCAVSDSRLGQFQDDEAEAAKHEAGETLRVQFLLSDHGALSFSEKKANICYTNAKGWSWNQTLCQIGGGLRPPLRASTQSAVVVGLNSQIIGFDKSTGQELWKRHLFCNHIVAGGEDDVLYVVGCDDVVYEGRVVVRERPLLALDAVSGRQLWEVDLLPFGNDMGCEPAKPSLLSPDFLEVVIDNFPPRPSCSLFIRTTTGDIDMVLHGDVRYCVHAFDRFAMVKDGQGICISCENGQQLWALSKTFDTRAGGKGGIVALEDGSFFFYHHSHAEATVYACLVDSQGKEEWWASCEGLGPRSCKTCGNIRVEVRGEYGILITCESTTGCWLISWQGKTVFHREL